MTTMNSINISVQNLAGADGASKADGLSPQTRQALMLASTANIANALLKRGFRNTCMLGLSPLSPDQPRMVGPAYTLRFIPAREDIDSLTNYGSLENKHRVAMEECPAGSVLVIDAFGNTRVSSMGDMMASRLKKRGVAGVVTDGGYRDTSGIKGTGLPAYQRQGASPATPIAMHALELNKPVGCAGVAIYPGDIIVGDADGVVVIPRHLVDEVAEEAGAAEEYEVFAALHIENGRSLMEMFPATPESLKEYERWVKAGRPSLAEFVE